MVGLGFFLKHQVPLQLPCVGSVPQRMGSIPWERLRSPAWKEQPGLGAEVSHEGQLCVGPAAGEAWSPRELNKYLKDSKGSKRIHSGPLGCLHCSSAPGFSLESQHHSFCKDHSTEG